MSGIIADANAENGCMAMSSSIQSYLLEQAQPGQNEVNLAKQRSAALLACLAAPNIACVYGEPVSVHPSGEGSIEEGTMWSAKKDSDVLALTPSQSADEASSLAYEGVIDMGVVDGSQLCLVGVSPGGQDNAWNMVALSSGRAGVKELGRARFFVGDFLSPMAFKSAMLKAFRAHLESKKFKAAQP
ncbi:hypothetical protein ACN9MB_10585 [Dyella kyungheensis]|uniref:hypothetical protein n=1 Tax=Dyella kyungheensis TaxID=1242174 RepID=UPI003CE67BA8